MQIAQTLEDKRHHLNLLEAQTRVAMGEPGAAFYELKARRDALRAELGVLDAAPVMGEIFETTLASGKHDTKGREIGYTVGLRDNGVDFYAWVQNARLVSGTAISGEWKDFGVAQRSKKFTSAEAARGWAYCTARERIANLEKTCRVLAK